MKKIKYLLVIILSLIFINTVSAKNPYKSNGPYGVNCTWYAWNMAYELGGVSLPGWRNAKYWYQDAIKDGYSVGNKPMPNSIVVWGDWTNYGHVGYVEKVIDDKIYVWDSTGPCIDYEDETYKECMANGVSEETDKECLKNAPRIACQYSYTNPKYAITGYIYLDISPKKTTQKDNIKETNQEIIKEEPKKSSDAYLESITLSGGEIAFSKEIDSYLIDVNNDIEKIEVSAIPSDNNATIIGLGEYILDIGENKIEILVTAQDNTKKTYTININRLELENHQEKEENDSFKLKNIICLMGIFLIIAIFPIIYFFRRNLSKKMPDKID